MALEEQRSTTTYMSILSLIENRLLGNTVMRAVSFGKRELPLSKKATPH